MVDVVVNDSGIVTTVNTVSGHPLLRNPAENAALKAVFRSESTRGVIGMRLVFRFMETGAVEVNCCESYPYVVIVVPSYSLQVDITASNK